MPIEKLEPLYVSQKYSTLLTGKKIFRHDRLGKRIYTTEDNKSYLSLTTLLGLTMPKQQRLETWRNAMLDELQSTEKVDNFVEMTADYGTYLHILVSEFVKNKEVNWNDFDNDAISYFVNHGFTGDVLALATLEIKKDFASLIQFFYDYSVQVIAVELPVFSDKYGIATCIDLVVDMLELPLGREIQRGQFERKELKSHRAIINLKSGKKGFFETHALQLAGEEIMFNETYSGVNFPSISNVYNLAPINWQNEPSYKLKNQTEEMSACKKKLQNYIQTAQLNKDFDIVNRKIVVFEGTTNFGESASKAITMKEIYDFIESQIVEEDISI